MAIHNQTGNQGELIAQNYIVNQGYMILHSNWRFQHKEVDVIAIDAHTQELVIFEVKTRYQEKIDISHLVNRKKCQNLRLAAEQYLKMYKIQREVRFDLVVIGRNKQVEQHIKQIFKIID